MHIKLFFLATFLIVSCAAQNYTANATTPGILIGNWAMFVGFANNNSQCCQPQGDLTITDNYNGTVTLTSTKWIGATCYSRPSSYQDLIYVNGNDSFSQLQSQYGNYSAGQLPHVSDAQGNIISIDVEFSSIIPPSLSLVYNVDESIQCFTSYTKSAEIMSMFTAVLIACLSMILA